MKRLLFIGGTSFFGKLAVKKLIASGQYDITLLTRGRNIPPEFKDQVHFIACDRKDPVALAAALEGKRFDIVVDNIAIPKTDVKNILDLLRGKIGHYLLCSTGAVYPQYGLHECTEDEAIFEGIMGQREYANHKREAEGMLLSYDDVPFTVFRPSSVQGPEDSTLRTLYFVEKLYRQTPFYIPDDVFIKHVYVEDVAEILTRLVALTPSNKAYNVVGDDKPSLQHYCDELARLINKPICYEAIPRADFLALNVAGFPVPYDRNSLISNRLVKQALNFNFTPMQKWLPITAQWCVDRIENPDSNPNKVVY